jgi:hypothetical protein
MTRQEKGLEILKKKIQDLKFQLDDGELTIEEALEEIRRVRLQLNKALSGPKPVMNQIYKQTFKN